jgi:hypothetical protein
MVLRRRFVPLALGGAAAALIVATAIFSVVLPSGGGDAGPAAVGTPATRSAAPQSAPPPGGSGFVPGSKRKVERAASITLAAPKDDIEDVADGVIRTADRYGGFVLDSSVSSGGQASGASIELRIPSSRLEPAIAELSKLGHVRERSQRMLDITADFSSPRRRLAEATAERRALLQQLARAVTPNETASVRARLGIATRRIEAARVALRRLETRVRFATVSVSVEPGAKVGGGRWTAGDAFGDALAVLDVAAGVLLVALAGLVPLTLLVALGWAGGRAYRWRARENALDAVEKPTVR